MRINQSFYPVLVSSYSLLLTLSIPFLILRWLVRGLKNPAYLHYWAERFGFVKEVSPEGFWIHAVSVGEVVAAEPIIRALRNRYPDKAITITTTTPTGCARLEQLLGFNKKDNTKHSQHLNNYHLNMSHLNIYHRYFPIDLPFSAQTFLNRIKPSLCIIMETELWPNWLEKLKQNKIPTLIINARLSPRSFRRYFAFKQLVSRMLQSLHHVVAQSTNDGERFLQLGLCPKKLTIAGNIKYDIDYPKDISLKAQQLRDCIGKNRQVFVAASTHKGEESAILTAFQQLLLKNPTAFLILVPRHPERFNAVAHIIQSMSLPFMRQSVISTLTDLAQYPILLGDTIGDLPKYYHASDIAFIGGTLVPIGGHNMLEAANAGIPIMAGPHIFNFEDICKQLQDNRALLQIPDRDALADTLSMLLQNETLRLEMGQQAKVVSQKNKGTVNIIQEIIESSLAL